MAVAVQGGLQSIISDQRLLDPSIELRTLWGLWFCYQFANGITREGGGRGSDGSGMFGFEQVLPGDE